MPFLFRNDLSRKCAVYLSQAKPNYSANESLALCFRSYVGCLFKRSRSRFASVNMSTLTSHINVIIRTFDEIRFGVTTSSAFLQCENVLSAERYIRIESMYTIRIYNSNNNQYQLQTK